MQCVNIEHLDEIFRVPIREVIPFRSILNRNRIEKLPRDFSHIAGELFMKSPEKNRNPHESLHQKNP